MSEKLVALRIRAAKWVESREDAGQGALEYVGMIAVAAVIVVAVAAALNPGNITAAVTTAVNHILTGK